MIQLALGGLVLLFSMPFLVRGWIFFLKPEHPLSLQAKERNLRMGLETDMKKWGRKVRRFGFLLFLVGSGLSCWGYVSISS